MKKEINKFFIFTLTPMEVNIAIKESLVRADLLKDIELSSSTIDYEHQFEEKHNGVDDYNYIYEGVRVIIKDK